MAPRLDCAPLSKDWDERAVTTHTTQKMELGAHDQDASRRYNIEAHWKQLESPSN